MSDIQRTTLANGLTIITDSVPHVHSVALGIWAGAGTRYESPEQNGIAHMVEHMLFKGTQNRNAMQIVEEVERKGGSLNAYTTRDLTSYSAHVLKEDTALALDILSDMMLNASLPEDELLREYDVITQEIDMTYDTPDDYIFDLYMQTAYAGQMLGSPILGEEKIIRSLNSDDLRNYIYSHYAPDNLIVSVTGNIGHSEIVEMVKNLFNGEEASQAKTQFDEAVYKGGESYEKRKLEQSHFMFGFQCVGREHPLYFSGKALSIILGDGMSSRLFQEVREKRGLAYAIHTYYSAYHETGQFIVYGGTSPQSYEKAMELVKKEIEGLRTSLQDWEIDLAKAQLRASILMSRESIKVRADQQARYWLYRNKIFDVNFVLRNIEAITRESLLDVLDFMLSQKPTLATICPE